MAKRISAICLFLTFFLSACGGAGTAPPSTSPDTASTPTALRLPDVILVYTLEGGIAGFCDRMQVYAGGEVRLSDCSGRESTGQLDDARLAQLHEWAETYGAFQYTQEDDAVADKMTAALQFNGVGLESSTPEVQQDVFAVAGEIWAQRSAAGQEAPPSPESPTLAPADGGDAEAILILSPGPGSRLTSPLTVSGVADSTFEQNLVVRLLSIDGDVLALVPTTIQAELGQGGPFEAELNFEASGEMPGFLQVYSTSPRDGGITHLTTVGVMLAEGGPIDLRPAGSQAERINLTSPGMAETISGGLAHVEGIALPSFEGTLIVEVLGEDGEVIGSLPIIVNAPDMGQFGPFTADVPYSLDASGPGRIVVRDPSPAFPGDVHLASVEVQLAP